MPIYEYRCRECGGKLEKLQRLSDARLVDCPACGKPGLQRLMSAAGFRLKGGGWYETDFKQGQKRNLAESGDNAGTDKSGKETTGKETTEKGGKGASEKGSENKATTSKGDGEASSKSSKDKGAAPSAGAA